MMRLILGALLLATPATAQSRAVLEDHREAGLLCDGRVERLG